MIFLNLIFLHEVKTFHNPRAQWIYYNEHRSIKRLHKVEIPIIVVRSAVTISGIVNIVYIIFILMASGNRQNTMKIVTIW